MYFKLNWSGVCSTWVNYGNGLIGLVKFSVNTCVRQYIQFILDFGINFIHINKIFKPYPFRRQLGANFKSLPPFSRTNKCFWIFITQLILIHKSNNKIFCIYLHVECIIIEILTFLTVELQTLESFILESSISLTKTDFVNELCLKTVFCAIIVSVVMFFWGRGKIWYFTDLQISYNPRSRSNVSVNSCLSNKSIQKYK